MAQHHFRVPHRPDPRRRPRHDEGTALQRRSPREERDRLRDTENHLFGARVLNDGAVVDGFDAEGVGVGKLRLRHEHGANRGGGVEAWTLSVFANGRKKGTREREGGPHLSSTTTGYS